MALRRAHLAAGSGWNNDPAIFFWRTPSRKEIAFISKEFQGVAVEGKHVEGEKWKGDAATVDASTWDGILITRNILDVSSTDAAWAVPAEIFGYLVDT